MNEIRETLNISYFDKEELSLKEHCDTYTKIKNDILNLLKKYDIEFVLAETEAIKDLQQENQSLKEELESWKKSDGLKEKSSIAYYNETRQLKDRIKKAIEYIEEKLKLIPKNCVGEITYEIKFLNKLLEKLKGDK